jgi:hypothetical protein
MRTERDLAQQQQPCTAVPRCAFRRAAARYNEPQRSAPCTLRRTAEPDARRGVVRAHARAHAWWSPCVSGVAKEARAAPVSGVARRPSAGRRMRALRRGPQGLPVLLERSVKQ